MGVALRACLSVLILVKVLIDAALAEGIQTFIDSVRVSEKSRAKRALQERMQVSLFDFPDEGGFSRSAQLFLMVLMLLILFLA